MGEGRGESGDATSGCVDCYLGVCHRAIRVLSLVLQSRDQVDLTVERKLALFPKPPRYLPETISVLGDIGREHASVLGDQVADIRHLGGLDADLAEHSLQREFNYLLGLSDYIRESIVLVEYVQDFETSRQIPPRASDPA